ncbi:MAG: hypothetical protein CMJ83_21030 [Planctomycetes bacterium]|nr:hypothetical protein [Planctomycetota bacterium]
MRPCTVVTLALLSLLAPAQVQFTDVTSGAGIAWMHIEPGQMMGVGGAWLDYDQDGWLDLLFVGGMTDPALYRNLGNGTFADVTAQSGIAPPVIAEWHMSATIGDYDDDGDPDVYIGTQNFNVLYRNNGNGSFTDVTAQANVAGQEWTTGAAFGDYDGDGDLDLYVGNYVAVVNFPYHTPFPNRLHRNNGDGTFTDVTLETGTMGTGTTLAVSWTDFDDDGDVDLMVANDFGAFIEPNRLYRNDGPAPGPPGTWNFTEVSSALGSDIAIYCMGITAGDFDRDLDLDYYYSNLGRNVLLRNDGAAGFADVTTATGTENTYDPTTSNPQLFATSWGVGFHDFDLDGWLDLYVSNGHIPAAPMIANGTATPGVLFHNDGASNTFSDVSIAAGVAHTGIGRGCFFGDYDNDGDVDIVQANIQGTITLFRNDSPNQGHYLKLKPRGRVSAADGHGTRVRVDCGAVSHIREVNQNYSFESSSEPAVNFGLGTETKIDRISARWPSGITHQVYELPVDGTGNLIEPVVNVGPTTNGPDVLAEGTTATWTLEIKNHTAVPQGAYHVQVIEIAGIRVMLPIDTASVPAYGSVTVPFSVTLPLGATGGATFPATLTWWVWDAGSGVDQWRQQISVMP